MELIECQEIVIEDKKEKNCSSKIFKKILSCLYNKQHEHMLQFTNLERTEFEVKFLNKKNPKWTKKDISLFVEVDSVSSKYRKKQHYEEECKVRFKANMSKLSKKYIKETSNIKVSKCLRIIRYKILQFPKEVEKKEKQTKKGCLKMSEINKEMIIFSTPVMKENVLNSHYSCLSDELMDNQVLLETESAEFGIKGAIYYVTDNISEKTLNDLLRSENAVFRNNGSENAMLGNIRIENAIFRNNRDEGISYKADNISSDQGHDLLRSENAVFRNNGSENAMLGNSGIENAICGNNGDQGIGYKTDNIFKEHFYDLLGSENAVFRNNGSENAMLGNIGIENAIFRNNRDEGISYKADNISTDQDHDLLRSENAVFRNNGSENAMLGNSGIENAICGNNGDQGIGYKTDNIFKEHFYNLLGNESTVFGNNGGGGISYNIGNISGEQGNMCSGNLKSLEYPFISSPSLLDENLDMSPEGQWLCDFQSINDVL